LIERLRATAGLEVLSLPFDSGVTMVRGRPLSRVAIEADFTNPGVEPGSSS